MASDRPQSFRITHPFHPLFDREFEVVDHLSNSGERYVFFHRDDGQRECIPARWTSLAEMDPFVILAAGRSLFRVEDLLLLRELIVGLRGKRSRR